MGESNDSSFSFDSCYLIVDDDGGGGGGERRRRRRQSDTAREQGRLVVKPKVVLLFSLLASLFVFDILKKNEEKEKTNDKNGKDQSFPRNQRRHSK